LVCTDSHSMTTSNHQSILPIFPTNWNKRCLAYGVLSHKKAEKLSIIVNDRKRQQRMGNTVAGKKKSKASSPAPKKKKAKIKMESAVASPVKSGII